LESIHEDSQNSNVITGIENRTVDPAVTEIHAKTVSNGTDRMPDILRLEMLSLLHTKPLTGYELRKSIKASFNHEISFGTLYPNLASLEKLGVIQGKWVSLGENQLRRKRIFTLTDMGKNYLTENLDKLNKLADIMQKMNVLQVPAQ